MQDGKRRRGARPRLKRGVARGSVGRAGAADAGRNDGQVGFREHSGHRRIRRCSQCFTTSVAGLPSGAVAGAVRPVERGLDCGTTIDLHDDIDACCGERRALT